jgi:hypothetical protein
VRLLLLWLSLSATLWAKQPATHPAPGFAIQLPANWSSPAPDQWCSPEGNLSLVWREVTMQGEVGAWARSLQGRFPGTLMGPLQSITVAGQPACSFMGEHLGKIQRVYLISRAPRGVVLVCSCSPTQSFAAVGVIQEMLTSFRWLSDQGK